MHVTIHHVRDLHNYLFSIPYIGVVNPAWFYFVVFIVSLVESIPLIGTFAPGTLLLLLFGFIATHPHIHLYSVILIVAFAAVLGDLFAYYLGKHSFKYISNIKWIKKYGKLDSGHAFFHKHGGKSILFARFIGPIRPIIPMLAGAVHMPMRKFMAWNITGSLVWASLYTTIGFIFGANFRIFAFWASRASLLAFIVIIIFVGLYGWKERKTQEVLGELEISPDAHAKLEDQAEK